MLNCWLISGYSSFIKAEAFYGSAVFLEKGKQLIYERNSF